MLLRRMKAVPGGGRERPKRRRGACRSMLTTVVAAAAAQPRPKIMDFVPRASSALSACAVLSVTTFSGREDHAPLPPKAVEDGGSVRSRCSNFTTHRLG